MTAKEIETHVEKLLNIGEDKVNEIRDIAREVCGPLKMEESFKKLDAIIGSLLGTRTTNLSSPNAIARANGEPYDAARIELFTVLFEELSAWTEKARPSRDTSGFSFRNSGFFDAYFSNFIEGTEFEIDEAKEIAFENKIPDLRPADAHDILGTFRIVANPNLMKTKVSQISPSDFLNLMKAWHLTIMGGRPDKRPGEFKEKGNQAGQTHFVEPGLVKATLVRGFELSRGLRSPFGRATFLMFLISEVHPFDDGNGRLARAIANAELLSHNECRVIVPTVFRTEYLDALRELSREREPRTLIRMADQAQEFTADIDFADFDEARIRLTAWQAFDDTPRARLRRPI